MPAIPHQRDSAPDHTRPSTNSSTKCRRRAKVGSSSWETRAPSQRPPIVGKFQVQKARELNIPPGPLYSKLKNGESVTYKNPSSSEEVTVHPEQVLEGGSDGIAVALIYCPDEYVFRQFYDGRMDIDNDNDTSTDVSASPNIGKLNQYKEKHHQTNNQSNATTNLELMVHHTPKKMFESEMYQAWMREFGTNVKHITLHPLEEGVHRFHFAGGESNEEFDGSPFRSGVMGAMQRSLIHSDIFPNPLAMAKCPSFSSESESKGDVVGGDANSNAGNDDSMTIYHGRPQLEYTFVPLAKKGLDTSTLKSTEKGTFGVSKEEREAIHNETKNSGALEAAAKILVLEEEKDTKNDDTQKNEASHASPASTLTPQDTHTLTVNVRTQSSQNPAERPKVSIQEQRARQELKLLREQRMKSYIEQEIQKDEDKLSALQKEETIQEGKTLGFY